MIPYRFTFWQAYFSGLLLNDAPRNRWVRTELFQGATYSEVPVIAGTEWLDWVLRFRAFWTRLAFEKFNTVPSIYSPAPPASLLPRRGFEDAEIDGGAVPLEQRYRPAVLVAEMEILRATTARFYQRDAAGHWQPVPALHEANEVFYREAFPPAVRARTLFLIGRDSAFYREKLTPEELERDELSVTDAVKSLQRTGYHALDYGTGFSPADYFDRTHLTPSGGEKLAEKAAPEISRLAQQLGYLK